MQQVAPKYTSVPLTSTVTIEDGNPVLIYGIFTASSDFDTGTVTLNEGDGTSMGHVINIRAGFVNESIDAPWLADKGLQIVTAGSAHAFILHSGTGI